MLFSLILSSLLALGLPQRTSQPIGPFRNYAPRSNDVEGLAYAGKSLPKVPTPRCAVPSSEDSRLTRSEDIGLPYLDPDSQVDYTVVCCRDCQAGDVFCLAGCSRQCFQGGQCTAAGEGSYAAYCQATCGVLEGNVYLPLRACEGECAAQVQELCLAHKCRDYGCEAPDCDRCAPLYCQMT